MNIVRLEPIKSFINIYIADDNDSRKDKHQGLIIENLSSPVENLLNNKCIVKYPAIIFAHSGELEDYGAILQDKIKDALQTGKALLVIYSSAGGSCVEKDLQKFSIPISNKVCIISRSISKNDPLSQDEFETIEKEIVEVEPEIIQFKNNNCLQKNTEYLSALFILCQSYLAAHFPTPCPTTDAVHKALCSMGWADLVLTEMGKNLAEIAAKKTKEITQTQKWQEVLFSYFSKVEDIVKSSLLAKLHTELESERLPDVISELVDVIFDKNVLRNPELIARAYLSLVDNLKCHNYQTLPQFFQQKLDMDTDIKIPTTLKMLQSVDFFGKGVEIAAIKTLLRLFSPESTYHYSADLDESIIQKITKEEDGLIVLVSSQQGYVANFAKHISHLRFHENWKGTLLLIAHPADVQEIQKWELFTLQQHNFHIAQVCVEHPVLLGELIPALLRLRSYSPSAIERLNELIKNKGSMSKAWKLWKEINNNPDIQSLGIMKELIQMITNEELILRSLINHRNLRQLDELAPNVQETAWEKTIELLNNVMSRIPQGN